MKKRLKWLLFTFLSGAEILYAADASQPPDGLLESVESAIQNKDFQFIAANTMDKVVVFAPREGPEFEFVDSSRKIVIGNRTYYLKKLLFESKHLKYSGIYSRSAFEIVRGHHEKQRHWEESNDYPMGAQNYIRTFSTLW